MRSLALKKLRSDYGVGVSPQRRNLDAILFPESVSVKENRQILLCKRSGGNPEIREIKKTVAVDAAGTRNIAKLW
jgi:hypothetical protein